MNDLDFWSPFTVGDIEADTRLDLPRFWPTAFINVSDKHRTHLLAYRRIAGAFNAVHCRTCDTRLWEASGHD